jgi:hypothetical protein
MKLPKVEQNLEEWQTATEALILAVEGRGPQMHARIGVLRGCTATSSGCSIPIAKTRIGESGS